MVWTKEKLEQIPEVYRDFMMILKPVVDSQKPGTILRITGIPFNMIYGKLADRYSYNPDQVLQLAKNLNQQEYIIQDELGFYQPTGKGEQLIQALAGEKEISGDPVPALPDL
jgi:hypothetical protein